ncbi:ABC-three component system protein [uncultured Acinetobacter sp.]|uniref:ABC-three component system protein n=1 Tax=uncultured Acinetobacter sp. TaxID=165433 RepID=UPI002590DCE1|nr:ABC-three component system protein [uncultured Acinetobacter sp.]
MKNNPYAAAASSIGYDYQIRLALLKSLELDESSEIKIEALDDIEISNEENEMILLSLKHKKEKEILSNLSIDFWKSVNIWIDRFSQLDNELSFLLCTTNTVAENSFLKKLTIGTKESITNETLEIIKESLTSSKNEQLSKIKIKFINLDDEVKLDILNRITIIEGTPRITDIPKKIQDTWFKPINEKHREQVYERLEGWWFHKVILLMTGKLNQPLTGRDVSIKLQEISVEYFEENLPITFDQLSDDAIDYTKYIDSSYEFVRKISDIKLKTTQIQRAIFDFYRASNQRIEWIDNSLISFEELEKFENKLIDEWARYKDDQYYEDDVLSERELIAIGRAIYSWSQNCNILIRSKVTEPYITRGSFHIIANEICNKLYWHPEIK